MDIEMEDPRLRATVRRIGTGEKSRVRLTLEYPAEDLYRDRVRTALADLLRPEPRATPPDPESMP